MPASALSLDLQILLALCAMFVCFGGNASFNGSWSIQGFLLLPPCNTSAIATACCPTCLGMSPFEYSVYIGLSAVVSVCSVFVSGLIIDTFGLPITVIACALLNFLGSAVRAGGSFLVLNHNAMIFCLVLGEMLLESTAYSLYTCREYIAIRYFESRRQPVVLGIAIGVSNTANLLSSLVAPSLADRFGIPTAMWAFTGLSLTGLLVGVVLGLIFCCSLSVQALERELCEEEFANSRSLQRRSCSSVVQSVTSFKRQYWIIFVSYAVAFGAEVVFESNWPAYSTRLENTSAVEAGRNMTYGFLGMVLLCPLSGFLLLWIGPKIYPALIIELLTGCSFALMFVTANIGLVSVSLFGMLMTTVKALCSYYVPVEALGSAMAFLTAAGMILLGIVSGIVGFILGHFPGKLGAHIALCFELSLVTVSVTLLILLWCCYGNPKIGEDSEHLLNSPKKERTASK